MEERKRRRRDRAEIEIAAGSSRGIEA
jgi:hypothetical protein